MPKVSLPARANGPRVGLAELWQAEVDQIDSLQARVGALLGIIATRLSVAPLAALSAVVSLTAVITLSFLIVVIDSNARLALTQGTENIGIRVVPLRPENAEELAQRLGKLEKVRAVRVINQDEALKEFSAALGNSKELLNGLESDNPLPVTIELSLSNLGPNPEAYVTRFVEQLHHQEGVDEVVYNASLVSSLGELLRGVKVFGLTTIIAVLTIGALLVGMTIRLGVYAHRHEIEVMQLVGADRQQIQLPFLVEAASVGVCASLASATIIWFAIRWLSVAVGSSQIAWMLGGEALSVSPLIWALIFITGIGLALLGAMIALRLQGQR